MKSTIQQIKEIERINEWKDKEVEKLQSGKEYLQSLVIEYYRIQKEQDSKFKLNTPYGKVTARKGSKVIQVSNEQEVIKQLEQRGFDNYVKVTKKLSQSDIKKDFNVTENGTLIDANGEVLEGASIVEKPTSYTVKVGEQMAEQLNLYQKQQMLKRILRASQKILRVITSRMFQDLKYYTE